MSPTTGPPIKILILGETANGKSTLIRQLKLYGENREVDIGIGYGNLSCTTEVGIYPLSCMLRTYYLKDRNGQRIKDVDFDELATYTDDDATMVANKPDDNGREFSFELIDTPGLDDSNGNDMEIMAGIVGRMRELGSLNTLVYVRSLDKPFGESFNRFYEYLQRCMPMLFNGLIIAHTSLTVDREDEAMSSGQNLRARRREAFKKATKGRADLTHVFMDNDPDTTNPFAVMRSYNSCYALLKHAASQRRISIANNLHLLKAPNMIHMDSQVLLALSRLQSTLKTSLAKETAAASRSKNRSLRFKREIARLRTNLAENEAELARLDTEDEVVLGSKTIAEDYSLEKLVYEAKLWLDKREVSYDSDSTITHMSKTTSDGCRWLDEDLRGTTWRATLKSSIFRSISGSATFYTTNRLKNKGKISVLRGRVRDAQESITQNEDMLEEMSDSEEGGAAAEKLGAHVERCAALTEKIQQDSFDAALWPSLRKFYSQARGAPSAGDIIEFVKVFDAEIARLLS